MPYRLRIAFAVQQFLTMAGERAQFVLTGIAAGLSKAGSTIWNVGTQTFTQGTSSPVNIASTGPSGYTAGGAYTVDIAGQQLPSGMTLTTAGVLDVGSATAQTVNNVVFEYTEPGALPILTLHPTSAGTYPYMATVYPAEGVVSAGRVIVSTVDTNLRCSILSTWPDGSAQVCVVAGSYTFPSTTPVDIGLRVGNASGTNLTTSDIVAAVSTVSVNFGIPLSLTLTAANHDRIWWANPQVICARYRLPITNKGDMEAVIDVHRFAGGRAFVEVVIENGKVNASAATVTAPATQTYTNATVSVNGTQIQGGAGISSPQGVSVTGRFGSVTYQNGHEGLRAWYCSGWVGGDPGIEVTHDTASMQAHPWFWKPAKSSIGRTYSTYYAAAYDTYSPWALGRMRVPDMATGGDDKSLALFPDHEADYVLYGSKYARRAVLATGLANFSLNWHLRHTDGSIPQRSQFAGKTTSANTWPKLETNEPVYGGGPGQTKDGAHIPATTLIPFLCRPSPCFIELAQKEFIWNHTNYNSTNGWHPYDQIRSRAWRNRNYAIACFLTPDSETTRKADMRTVLRLNADNLKTSFFDVSWNQLNVLWFYGPSPSYGPISREANSSPAGSDGNGPSAGDGYSYLDAEYMMMFCAFSWGAISRAKVLRGTDATAWDEVATTMLQMPVRIMNESTAGEWRLRNINIATGLQVGTTKPVTLNQGAGTWGPVLQSTLTGTVPANSGTWITGTSAWSSATYQPQFNWPEWFHFALAAAVDHGISGADSAWTKMVNGLTNYSTWVNTDSQMAVDAKINRTPRNAP